MRLSSTQFLPVVSDGQFLVFPDATFDAVLCQLGLMFFPDPARGLAEFRRVGRPGRRAAVCVISLASRAPMWGILAETLSALSSRACEDTPPFVFVGGRYRLLKQLVRAAGFADVRVSREVRREAYIPSFDF